MYFLCFEIDYPNLRDLGFGIDRQLHVTIVSKGGDGDFDSQKDVSAINATLESGLGTDKRYVWLRPVDSRQPSPALDNCDRREILLP